jgi:hypothetical protein
MCARRKTQTDVGVPLVLRNEPNVANPKCFSQSPSVTAGVEFIDENGGAAQTVEVVKQSYEADHDAPTPTKREARDRVR